MRRKIKRKLKHNNARCANIANFNPTVYNFLWRMVICWIHWIRETASGRISLVRRMVILQIRKIWQITILQIRENCKQWNYQSADCTKHKCKHKIYITTSQHSSRIPPACQLYGECMAPVMHVPSSHTTPSSHAYPQAMHAPSHAPCEQTDTRKTITFSQLRLRAAKIGISVNLTEVVARADLG